MQEQVKQDTRAAEAALTTFIDRRVLDVADEIADRIRSEARLTVEVRNETERARILAELGFLEEVAGRWTDGGRSRDDYPGELPIVAAFLATLGIKPAAPVEPIRKAETEPAPDPAAAVAFEADLAAFRALLGRTLTPGGLVEMFLADLVREWAKADAGGGHLTPDVIQQWLDMLRSHIGSYLEIAKRFTNYPEEAA